MSLSALILLLSPAPVVVDGDVYVEREIHTASQLVPWCRDEAEARVVANGGEPYQWRASYHDRGKLLQVEGKLRVDGKDVAVRCRIARGARERYASIEFVASGA
jgi:hypothetical protein